MKKLYPKYSVLMSLYRNEKPEYLNLAIQSMVDQTYKPDEIVIVKDGSITEQLQRVLDDFDIRYPGLFNIVGYEENRGLGYALNFGLENCRNELIARMDTDDISKPDRCKKQIEMFVADLSLDIVGCPVVEFKDTPDNIVGYRNVPLTNEAIHAYAHRRDPFNHPTVMYRKSKVVICGSYGDYRKNQDTDLWIRMLSKGCRGANCSEYLFLFRFDEGTYEKRKSWINTKTLIKIRKNAWQIGFISLVDFGFIVFAQMGIYLMPAFLQRFVYRNFLRTR